MAQIMQWLHAIWNYMKKVKSSISMVFGLIPNIHSLLVEQFYTMRTGNGLRMRRKHPISTQPRGHTSTFESER